MSEKARIAINGGILLETAGNGHNFVLDRDIDLNFLLDYRTQLKMSEVARNFLKRARNSPKSHNLLLDLDIDFN